MAAVTEVLKDPVETDFAAKVGAVLEGARRKRKLRLRHLADAQLSVATLKAAERGQLPLSRPMLTQLASRYGVDLGELFGPRHRLRIDSDSISIAATTEPCEVGSLNSMLNAYLRLIDAVRTESADTTGPMRRDDIAQLADHLDAPCTTVISRLGDLIEARGAETRAMIDLYLTGASVVGLKTFDQSAPC